MSDLSWLNPTPHAIAVYASQPTSPLTTQTLATKRTLLLTWAGLPPAGSHQLCLAHSFNHLVGAQQERLWNREAKRFGGREIDDEIELGRLLHRQVARLGPAQNLVDIVAGAAKQVGNVWSVGNQTTRFDELPVAVHRRQSRAERQGVDANPVGVHERLATDVKRIRAASEPLESGGNLLGSPNFKCGRFKAKGADRGLNLAHFHHGGGIANVGQDR